MKAQNKRHIGPGSRYNALFPASARQDSVVVGSGKARLHDTLNLMKGMVRDTKSDTVELAKILKGHNVTSTCRNIWNFVYGHIQYKMDATGIEQVRRPSRTWADRATGVDCDCYTVFIGSILSNLGIPFKMRITKYGGKQHFQHVYPIVPLKGGHIAIDCVADTFNYEVPYSEKKDFDMGSKEHIKEMTGLSGVDMADIGLDALERQGLPLRTVVRTANNSHCNHAHPTTDTSFKRGTKPGTIVSPFRFDDADKNGKGKKNGNGFNLLNFLVISGISVAAGIGVYRMLGNRKKNVQKTPAKNRNFKKRATAPK